MKFSIKDFFIKCDQIRCFLRIWPSTEEIPNGKLHFLCRVVFKKNLLKIIRPSSSSFFLVTLFRVGLFLSVAYLRVATLNPTWNLGSLLGLS